MTFVDASALEAGLEHVRKSPADDGEVRFLVRRPATEEREVLDEARLTTTDGVDGDSWRARSGSRPDGSDPDPDKQLNVMNARVLEIISPDRDRWALAGDQLYLDLDLSVENTPPGTYLALGDAVIEITPPPHNGCAKFRRRFGEEALRWVNSEEGKRLRLRGVNARVVQEGTVRVGDRVRKV